MADRMQHIRKIAGRKGQITKLINNIRDAMYNNEACEDIRVLQIKLEDCREAFVEEIFSYIADVKDDEKDEVSKKKENEIEMVDQKIEVIDLEIKQYLLKNNVNEPEVKPESEVNIQLEKINLPKFSGSNYFYWKSIFDVTVLDQPWSDKTKMIRLISCLEGEAKMLISHYPPVAASFPVALGRLEEEYGGQKRLVSEAVNKVRRGRTVCEEDAVEIRRFISVLEATRVVMTPDHLPELEEAGALFFCAKERLASGLLRKYLEWSNTKTVSENFNSLIDFLTQWLKIIKESKVEGPSKIKKSPIMTYSQSIKESDVGTFISLCPWHKIEKSVEVGHYLNLCDEFKKLSVQERRNFVFKNKLCFLCLKPHHTAGKCKNFRAECKRCAKGNRHHYLLHVDRNEPSANNEVVESHNCQLQAFAISLQTVPVFLCNGNKKIKVNALLDPGSNTSFVNNSVVNQLNLKDFGHETRYLNTINQNDQSISVAKVKLEIESLDNKIRRSETVLTLKDMLLNSTPIDWQVTKHKFKHLKNLDFPTLAENKQHEMLIGADLIYYHRCYKEIKGLDTAPIAKLTCLGWTAVGPTDRENKNKSLDIHLSELGMEDLNNLVTRQWDLESIGIREDQNLCRMSKEDQKAIDDLNQGMEYVDQRYMTPILWKPGCPDLRNNFESVRRRTCNMERRLALNPDNFKSCKDVIDSYLDKGYVTEISLDRKDEASFYVPYFPIFKVDRLTTKCRLVFDCAAKFNGRSLNDQIRVGPKLQNDIVSVMIRFRKYSFGLIGDISEFYLQLGLRDQDRKFCRFIFNEKIYEWSRLIFGRSDSPFVALHVIREHALKFKDQFSETVNSITKSMYIDDLCDSCDDSSSIQDLVRQSREIFSKMGMKIHKFMTNDKEGLSTIPSDCIIQNKGRILDDESVPSAKTLGMLWKTDSDNICYTVHDMIDFSKQPCTKRNILRSNARIFDPLGYLSPFLVLSKILFQRVWVLGLDWDQEVPDNIKNEWLSWYHQVKSLSEIEVPRHLGIIKGQEFSLHGFCDASSEAYSCCIYVRVKTGNQVKTRLVIARTRVSPLKSKSIPQLELMGATILSRLIKKVGEALEVSPRSFTLWSDSLNVLGWLRRPAKQFRVFYAHRIGEIQTTTEPDQWRHVPTALNPADLPSRGLSVTNLKNNSVWWQGPAFLQEEEGKWPPNLGALDKGNNVSEEFLRPTPILTCTVQVCDSDFPLNPERWSNKIKLITRLGYVLRFITNIRLAPSKRFLGHVLSREERRNAEDILVRICQQEAFSEDLTYLKQHQCVNRTSKIRRLMPFLDAQGLLRSRSRLEAIRWINKDFKLPLILPEKHAVTKLIIGNVHDFVGHSLGVNATLAELNKRFWIIKARVAVKRFQSSCMRCKIDKAKASRPEMAPLPEFRFAPPHQAFKICGCDFAGPFETKSGIRGRPKNKRYLALFTCLQTRAVHLEVVSSLESACFINAFVRMISRRGCPSEMITDNGTTFIRAEKEINEQIRLNKIRIGLVKEPIVWRRIPPYGSNFGGIYERLIRSARRALVRVLGSSDITDEELQTAFCVVEDLLNSRPLTTVSDDIKDDLPLTPNHFLIGRLNLNDVLDVGVEDRGALHPATRWKYIQMLVQHYWRRWMNELMNEYKSRSKWVGSRSNNIQENDVVILLDPISTGRKWKMGRVTKVFPGFDKKVRAANVCIDGKEFRRPVSKMCPLELNHV